MTRVTIYHPQADRRGAHDGRTALAAWRQWADYQADRGPLGRRMVDAMGAIRSALLAGDPVSPSALLSIARLSDGIGWAEALALIGRSTAAQSAPRGPVGPARTSAPPPPPTPRYGRVTDNGMAIALRQADTSPWTVTRNARTDR